MNKNIKRIIACTLAAGTVAIVAPDTTYNVLAIKAYASNDAHDVGSIDLKDKDGNSLKLYTDAGCTNAIDKNFDDGDTYYTTTTSAAVKFASISGPNDEKIRIFRDNYHRDYKIGSSISLTNYTTTLDVRVYKHDYNDSKHYDSNDYDEYKIKVKYTGDYKELDDDYHHYHHYHHDHDYNDDDYLESINLYDKHGDEIKLYKDKEYDDRLDNDDLDDDNEGDTFYAKTSSDKIRIETDGVDDDYVRVFKSTNDSAKDEETGEDISISGDKTLTIRVYRDEPDDDIKYEDDDDVIGEYKIKLKYTGDKSSDTIDGNGAASTNTNTASTIKVNQWVQVNGYWQYNDSCGNPLKTQWYYDRYYGKWYYLEANGIMAANRWILSGNKWYYVGANGAMLTNSWILTGGKYYYVGYDGAMLTNTIISGYKVGTDGAWIE